MKKVLIAHYNKDINWVSKINKDLEISIYTTSDPNKELYTPLGKVTNYVPNKGMDTSMYLKYIIDNYYTLPDKSLFVHHHEIDHTQDYDLPFIINNLNWSCDDYFSICRRDFYGDVFIIDPRSKKWIQDCWFLFEKYLEFPVQLVYYAGTQFCVNKELIMQYPYDYWVFLYDWVMTTPLEDWLSGRIFEWCWHYLLTKNSIEIKRDIGDIILKK